MQHRSLPGIVVLSSVALLLPATAQVAKTTSLGILFNAAYTGEPINNLSGLVYVLYNNSSEFSAEYVGDAQIVSNIDAQGGLRLFEVWLDWAPRDAGWSTRLGPYDLNTEFDSTETAGLFLNGPTIFPVTSLALRLRTEIGNAAYGQLAVLDGVPGDPADPESNKIDLSSDDGALLVLEGGADADNHETSLELTYRAPMTDWLTL